MLSVGEQLKQARLKKQLSLEEAYRQTKIYPQVLQALEEDRAHNFLSPVYLKGFLKTYAKYLGLDGEIILKEYLDSQKQEAPPAEIVFEKKEKASLGINPWLILKIALTIFLVFIFFFYFRTALKYISALGKKIPRPKVELKVAPTTQQAARKNLVLELRTKQDCWIKVTVDGQSLFEGTLPKGKIERWQAKEKLELRLGKPEVVEVLLNGKPIDLKKVQVKHTLVITHEGIQGK